MPRPLTPAELDELRAAGLIDDPVGSAPDPGDTPREGPALGMARQKHAAARQSITDAEAEQAIVERVRAERGEDRDEALIRAEIDRELGRYTVLGPSGPVTAEEAEDTLAAMESPDTLAKKRARVAAGAFPLKDHGPSARDEAWQAKAESLSRESPLGVVTGISAAMDEPIPADEVVDKPWARDLTEGLTTAATMPLVMLSPVDSAVQWLSDGEWNMPVVPTLGEIAAMPGQVKRGFEGAMADEDADINPVKVATRAGLALGGGEAFTAQLEALGAPPEVVAEAGKAMERATFIPSFDTAARAAYEGGEHGAMEGVPFRDLPASLQGTLDLALVRRAVEPGGMLYDEPAAALLQRAVERGESELLVEREASELPIGVLRSISPGAVPGNKAIADEWKKRARVQELTGTADSEKFLKILAAATVDKEDGEIYFVPSKIQRALSWAGVLPEVAWEADVPLNVGGWNPASWAADALGYEQLATALGEARIPTKAGWESWVATGALNPYLHEQGYRGSEAPLLRPGLDTNLLGRVGASVAHADYQGPGLADALRRQGEPEQSALSKWALAADTVVDVAMPVDDLVLAGMGAPLTGARRAWVAGNTGYRSGLRGTRVAKAAAAGAIPVLVGETDRLAALDKVVREGIEAETLAGNRLFSENALGDKPPPPFQDPGAVDWKIQRDVARKMEAAGVNPQEAADAVNEMADENRRLSWDAAALGLKNRGGPADVAMRKSPGYVAVRAKYDDLAAAGNVTPREVDVAMAGAELLAWKAVADGKYATPEEFFAAHRVELGGTPGAGAYFQGDGPETGPVPSGGRATTVIENVPTGSTPRALGGGDAFLERRRGTVLGSIEPGMTIGPLSSADWIIRFFSTADIGTVLHENAHLMRFVMGDDWVDELVKFLPHEPDPARPGKMRLTREGEERFADGFGRLMRGKIAPSGRLRAYYDEFKDRLSDLWMRVRGLPVGVSPEMRRWFDASLNPAGALRKVDVPVSGDALPGRPVKTTVEADVAARLEQEGVKRTGQVLGDVSTLDSPGASIDVVVGSRSARQVDALEAVKNALADTAVETARRQWGFTGDVTKLTRRTHVPRARAESVLRRVDNTMRAIHGPDIRVTHAVVGLDATGDLAVFGDVIALDPVAAARMKMHVGILADSGTGYEALRGTDLLDPRYDFASMPREDYNRVREATIDRLAGPGARIDRVAAQNVGNAAYGFLKFLSDAGPVGGMVAGATAGTVLAGPGAGTLIGALGGAFLYSERVSAEMKAAFTVNFRVSEYTNPAVADVYGEVTRELGDVTGRFKRAIDDVKRKNPVAMRHEILNAIARSMPAMSVQVPDIPEMLRLHAEWVRPLTSRVEKAPTLDGLLVTLDDVAGFIARNPAVAATARESEDQALLALAGYKADPRAFGLLASDEQHVIADAVGILHDALRRRGEAVRQAGANIGIAMSGSDEKKLWEGLHKSDNLWGQLEKAAEFYAKFYDGDWNGILLETGKVGQATSPQSGFDPVAATAAAITRMMALDVLNRFSAKMLDAGIALDVDTATRLGRQFETFRPIGATDAAGLDRAAFRDEVLRCIQAEMSFKMIGADVVDTAARKKVATEQPPGTMGQFSPDAYRAALSILSSWGFKPGADTAWKALVLGDGSEVMVPEGLWGELTGVMDRAAKAGLAWAARGEAQPVLGRWYNVEGIAQKMEGATSTVKGAVAARAAAREDTFDRRVARVAQGVLDFAGWSYSMSRVNMVSGVGIPNPANFIGNLFGGAVQLYEGKGATGALRVLGRYAMPTANGKVLRHAFLSLFDDYRGWRLPGLWRPQAVMVDGRGMVWTGESIADEARRAGLHSSQARAESTWKLVDALRQREGKWWARVVKDFKENTVPGAAWRQFVARPFNWWQDVLMETSTAIDNLYRVGAFIDELSIGKGVDEAAETARRVAFDYNAVTDFERATLRPIVMFYTYTRRNMDLQWWTMLNHPSRFAGSLRGIRDAQEMVLGEQSELIWPEYMDGRLILGMRETARDASLHGTYAGVARVAPPVGPSDSVVLMARLLGTVTGAEEERRETMSMLSPWFQFPVVAATGYDIWSGRDIESNTVPAWLVEADQQALDGLLTTDLFDVDASPEYDPMNEPHEGESHFTARNPVYWWAFRNLMPIGGGRTIDTVTAMARADWLSSAIPGGIVTAGVEAAQAHRAGGGARLTDPLVDLARDGIDWLPGVNPYPGGRDYVPSPAADVEERRVGMTEGEELGALLAVKPVRVPTRGEAVDRLMRRREQEMQATAREQERSEPY